MAKQTVLAKKRRGPPPTGKGTQVVVRMQPSPLAALDAWAAKQSDKPTRAEAIRRLVELGLAVKQGRRATSTSLHNRAASLAAEQLDRMGDNTASMEERAERKGRLLKGPRALRQNRKDRPK